MAVRVEGAEAEENLRGERLLSAARIENSPSLQRGAADWRRNTTLAEIWPKSFVVRARAPIWNLARQFPSPCHERDLLLRQSFGKITANCPLGRLDDARLRLSRRNSSTVVGKLARSLARSAPPSNSSVARQLATDWMQRILCGLRRPSGHAAGPSVKASRWGWRASSAANGKAGARALGGERAFERAPTHTPRRCRKLLHFSKHPDCPLGYELIRN